jgi:hypothetical protein
VGGAQDGMSRPFAGVSAADYSSGSASPLGFDLGDLVNTVVPIVLSTLSANPQVSPQGFGFQVQTPFGGLGLGVNSAQPQIRPQGFDLGGLLQQIVPIVVKTAVSALSATPQVGQRLNPQSFGFQVQTPFGGAGLGVSSAQPQIQPQGFDIGGLLQQIVPIAVHAALSALAASPQVAPQGFGHQAQAPFGAGGLGVSSAQPQIQPQSIDWGSLVQQITPIALNAVMSALSAAPQIGPQGPGAYAPIGGAGLGVSSAQPAFRPQAFDWTELVKQVVPVVLSTLAANPQAGPMGGFRASVH